MKRVSMRLAVFVVGSILFAPVLYGAVPSSLREGGWYIDDMSKSTVQNFFSYFTYEGLQRSSLSAWTTRNDSWWTGVDWYDWSYYTGHGCAIAGGGYGFYGITTYGGATCINLLDAGNNSNGGYGRRLKYLVLHSCETVASPFDDPDAPTRWLEEPGSIFDGLHILMGFRTQTDQDNGLNIADEMGYFLNVDYPTVIVWNWENAVETYGDPVDPWMDQYAMYSAYADGHFYEAAYSSFWDVYGVSQSASYDNPSLYAMWSQPE